MDSTPPLALRCPACKYDVSQTLRDGIEKCPECGWEIDRRLCIISHRRTPTPRQALLLAVWLLGPWVVLAIGIASQIIDSVLVRLFGYCLALPMAAGVTVVWWVHYERIYGLHREITPLFVIVMTLCLIAPIVVLLIGYWM